MIKTYGARKLGRRPAARKMLLRQLATHLIHYERITTTCPRAKELKVYTERMISYLSGLSDATRKAREISRWLAPNGLNVERKLSQVVLGRSRARSGGYLRVLRLTNRASDQAPLARVELVV